MRASVARAVRQRKAICRPRVGSFSERTATATAPIASGYAMKSEIVTEIIASVGTSSA